LITYFLSNICAKIYQHWLVYVRVIAIQSSDIFRTLKAKNSSGDEIANVNFYAVYARKVPKFAEIMQNNGYYAVQRHSRSPILVPIESSHTISY